MPKKLAVIFIITTVLVLISLVLYRQIGDNLSFTQDNQTITTAPTDSVLIEGNNAELPEGFPQYPGSEVSDTWMRDTQESIGSSFVLHTDDEKNTVFNFYKNQLMEMEWGIENEDSENYVLDISKENTRGYIVISEAENEQTLISITFAQVKND